MKAQRVNKLIVRLINNSITKTESEELAKWLDNPDSLDYFNEIIKLHHLTQSHQEFDYHNALTNFNKITKKEKKRIPLKVFYYAASVILLLGVTFILKFKSPDHINSPKIVNNNIEIGAGKAILTLSDGTDVALEEGEIFEKENIISTGNDIKYTKKETKLLDISYHSLTIPRGGYYHLELSDGTKVWLNSETQLKYPENFIQGEPRIVELKFGEAYFDVSSSELNNGSTFKVLTRDQELEVLGTEFNIKAYSDETEIYTTLVEGEVGLNTGNSSIRLEPNQQAVLVDNSDDFSVSSVEIYNEISWKNGIFSFERKTLKDIMKVLSRWYDMEVKFENENIEKIKFIGVLKKSQNIVNILNNLKELKYINNYSIEDKTITIY